MITERIAQRDAAHGFILDGYPRNSKQAEDLERVLAEKGRKLDAAVLMEVDNDVLMKRLTGRRTCSKTGKLLNVYFSPQQEIDACLRAGGTLIQRDDDKEDTIRNRLDVYARQTAPLIAHYAGLGLLRTVAAEGPVDDVYRRLIAALGLAAR
jgi:adenylate kinase